MQREASNVRRQWRGADWSLGTAALLTVLFILVTGVPARSQPSVASYILGPGDVLEVTVWGYPELTRVVTVLPDGKIALPLVGIIAATGTSVGRLTTMLTQGYAVYLINPQVTVIIRESRKVRVSVLGQVHQPGTYFLPYDARLLDAISAAGGVTEVAALDATQLLSPGSPPMAIDVQRLLAGDPTFNVLLRGGETLVVPEDQVNLVGVVGEVKNPGRYRLKGEMRVLDVLLLAGGLTDRASVTEARLVRASRESQPLHLDRLLLGQDMSRNIVLKAGDALFIPEDTTEKIYVIGDVRNPGVYPLRGKVTLLQALAIAGGPVQHGVGTSQSAYIIRRNGTSDYRFAGTADVKELSNRSVLLSVDLRELINNGKMENDVTMQPGDVVVVNESSMSAFQAIVNILSGIAGIFYPFHR